MAAITEPQKKLEYQEITDWPKLAWAAVANPDEPVISVLHGRCVETTSSWCAEAVWDGDFTQGDFDRTDLVFGTGVRIRGDQVFFVSSGDTLNRLHYYQAGRSIIVSNSLPVLLSVAGIDLLDDYDYAAALTTVINGLNTYQKTLPTLGGDIGVVYFDNLLLDDNRIVQVAKTSSAPDFIDFTSYRDYLFKSAQAIGKNASANGRKHRVGMLTTVSSGYDSCAAAVVSKEAGTTQAVTISQGRRDASNLFSLNDSGAQVAEQLGLSCRSYLRKHGNYLHEDAAWASMGNVGDINLSIFDYPKPLSLLFTGFMGDILWDKDTVPSEPLHRKDTSGARFNETRLELGVFVCSPPLWGCKKEEQILRLSHLPEMRPWTLGNSYDRPIPRRLLEEAGVQRGSFATKKRLASFNRRFGRPLSENLHEDFAKFLAERGLKPGNMLTEKLVLILSGIDWIFLRKLPKKIQFSCKDWIKLPSPTLFFLWANRRLAERYKQALKLHFATEQTGCIDENPLQ